MRRPRPDAWTQTSTSPFRTTRRTPKVPTVIAWLALGAGLTLILALLTAELAPAIQALVRFPTSAERAIDQQLAPREGEIFGLVPVTFDDVFARL
jgi:hypothetical protein